MNNMDDKMMPIGKINGESVIPARLSPQDNQDTTQSDQGATGTSSGRSVKDLIGAFEKKTESSSPLRQALQGKSQFKSKVASETSLQQRAISQAKPENKAQGLQDKSEQPRSVSSSVHQNFVDDGTYSVLMPSEREDIDGEYANVGSMGSVLLSQRADTKAGGENKFLHDAEQKTSVSSKKQDAKAALPHQKKTAPPRPAPYQKNVPHQKKTPPPRPAPYQKNVPHQKKTPPPRPAPWNPQTASLQTHQALNRAIQSNQFAKEPIYATVGEATSEVPSNVDRTQQKGTVNYQHKENTRSLPQQEGLQLTNKLANIEKTMDDIRRSTIQLKHSNKQLYKKRKKTGLNDFKKHQKYGNLMNLAQKLRIEGSLTPKDRKTLDSAIRWLNQTYVKMLLLDQKKVDAGELLQIPESIKNH